MFQPAAALVELSGYAASFFPPPGLIDGGKTIASRTIPVQLFTMFSGDTEGIDEAV
jgi:hypothetical protein